MRTLYSCLFNSVFSYLVTANVIRENATDDLNYILQQGKYLLAIVMKQLFIHISEHSKLINVKAKPQCVQSTL